jgi:hypothetical protein
LYRLSDAVPIGSAQPVPAAAPAKTKR